MKKCGIYQIKNLINNKIYIGSTILFTRRLSEHLHFLRGNKHINNHLQYAFNKYGEENFEFKVLEIIDKNKEDYRTHLLQREQYYIDITRCYNDNIGYNIRKSVNNVDIGLVQRVLVDQFDLNGNFIKRWNSISEASQSLGISNSGISSCISTKRKSAGGYIWKASKNQKFNSRLVENILKETKTIHDYTDDIVIKIFDNIKGVALFLGYEVNVIQNYFNCKQESIKSKNDNNKYKIKYKILEYEQLDEDKLYLDEQKNTPLDDLIVKDRKELLNKMVNKIFDSDKIKELHKKVLYEIFFENKNQTEIASKMPITKQMISKILLKHFPRKIKAIFTKKEIKDLKDLL